MFNLARRILGSTVLRHAEPIHDERDPLIVEYGLCNWIVPVGRRGADIDPSRGAPNCRGGCQDDESQDCPVNEMTCHAAVLLKNRMKTVSYTHLRAHETPEH